MNYSEPELFFSKKIHKIDLGRCLKSIPCVYDNIKVTYKDGEIKYFKLDEDELTKLAEENNYDIEFDSDNSSDTDQ